MVLSYIVPAWFFRIDSFIEIIFSLITLFISLASFRVYYLTKEKNIERFGVGFLLMSASYFCWAIINALTIPEIRQSVTNVGVQNLNLMSWLGVHAYMMLFVAGLVMIAYSTFSLKKGGIYYLILGPTLMVIAISLEKFITFRILSIFFLSFIAYNYLLIYSVKQNRKSLGAFIGFLLLLVSNLIYLLSPLNAFSYVLSHAIELTAYLLFSAVLIRAVYYKQI